MEIVEGKSCKFPLERAKTTSPTKTGRLTIVKSAKNSNSFQYVIAKDTVPECVQMSFNEPDTNISDLVVVNNDFLGKLRQISSNS